MLPRYLRTSFWMTVAAAFSVSLKLIVISPFSDPDGDCSPDLAGTLPSPLISLPLGRTFLDCLRREPPSFELMLSAERGRAFGLSKTRGDVLCLDFRTFFWEAERSKQTDKTLCSSCLFTAIFESFPDIFDSSSVSFSPFWPLILRESASNHRLSRCGVDFN